MLKKLRQILIATSLILVSATTFSNAYAQDKTGPALGDTIDLLSFSTRDGRTLHQVMKAHSIALILLVHPSCGTCTETAKVGFRNLREKAGQPRIPYYVLMIPDSSDTETYFAYADSLKVDSESFVWSNKMMKPPTSLGTMTIPSHLMITNEGLVVNKWPGSTPKE